MNANTNAWATGYAPNLAVIAKNPPPTRNPAIAVKQPATHRPTGLPGTAATIMISMDPNAGGYCDMSSNLRLKMSAKPATYAIVAARAVSMTGFTSNRRNKS
jgi:hypothetical protein